MNQIIIWRWIYESSKCLAFLLIKMNKFAVLELNDLMRINTSFIQSVRSLNCDEEETWRWKETLRNHLTRSLYWYLYIFRYIIPWYDPQLVIDSNVFSLAHSSECKYVFRLILGLLTGNHAQGRTPTSIHGYLSNQTKTLLWLIRKKPQVSVLSSP